MSQKKVKHWSVRFELAPENDLHVLLHEHLEKLKEADRISEWIRQTLIAALPARGPIQAAVELTAADVEEIKSINQERLNRTGVPLVSPNEVLAQRKAFARDKHPVHGERK